VGVGVGFRYEQGPLIAAHYCLMYDHAVPFSLSLNGARLGVAWWPAEPPKHFRINPLVFLQ